MIEEKINLKEKFMALLMPLVEVLEYMNKDPSIEMWYGHKCLRITCNKLSAVERKIVDNTISSINSCPLNEIGVEVFCHGTINPNPFIYTEIEDIKREYFSFMFVIDEKIYYFFGGKEMIEEELNRTNQKIDSLKKELEKETEKRHKLHIDYCENVTNHNARCRVISHNFSNENCVREGYTTFEYEVYDYTTNEILMRDEISCYYEMPLLSDDPDTNYCCGTFQLNREVVAWDLFKRSNKYACQYYQAIVWGIEKYIHDNHLGCGKCE